MVNKTLDQDFIKELLKCAIINKSFLQTLITYVPEHFMPDGVERKVYSEIRRQFKINQKVPTIGQLKLEFQRDTSAKELLSDMRDIVVPDEKSILVSLEDFILRNRFVEIYDTMGVLYNQGKRNKAYDKFVEGAKDFSTFSLFNSSFSRVFGGFKERQTERMQGQSILTRRPLGIAPLDDLMDGGPEDGEYTLFLGESGVGKSICMIGAGIASARIGERVFHVQAEGTKKQCLNRYDSAWIGALYKDMKIGNIESHILSKARKVITGIGKGEIFVESFEQFNTANIGKVRSSLIELTKLHGHISRVIVDYLELFDPDDGRKYSPGEERFRQTAVSRQLKNIAVEFGCDVVSNTQSTSIRPEDQRDKNFKMTRFNLSEDKGKIRPVDNFITINQTPDEKDEEVVRLYGDKFREHHSGQTVSIAQNLSRTRFFDRKRTIELFLEEE